MARRTSGRRGGRGRGDRCSPTSPTPTSRCRPWCGCSTRCRTRTACGGRCATSPRCAAACSACVGTSVALGDHLVAHPADWHALEGELGADPEAVRPTLYARQAALLGAVGADPSDADLGHRRRPRRPDRRRRPSRRCGRPTAAACSSSPRATRRGRSPSRRSAREMADLASATLSAGSGRRARVPARGRGALPARGHRHGQGRRARAELRERRRRGLRRRGRRRRLRRRRAAHAPPAWPAR